MWLERRAFARRGVRRPLVPARELSSEFFSEGASAGDFNRDGVVDIIAGPYWFAGPKFDERHEIYPAKPFSIEGYSENFFAFPYDVDGDGWLDVVSIAFPGKEACWYQNPQGRNESWPRHVAWEHVDNESPTFADLTGDGRPELVFQTGGQFGYAEIPAEHPERMWRFTPISPAGVKGPFIHGLGVGDINGDGRADFLERTGWWEQPADRNATPMWEYHPVAFAAAGGAQMYAYDVDGDGDNDVITSKAAHAQRWALMEPISLDHKT